MCFTYKLFYFKGSMEYSQAYNDEDFFPFFLPLTKYFSQRCFINYVKQILLILLDLCLNANNFHIVLMLIYYVLTCLVTVEILNVARN